MMNNNEVLSFNSLNDIMTNLDLSEFIVNMLSDIFFEVWPFTAELIEHPWNTKNLRVIKIYPKNAVKKWIPMEYRYDNVNVLVYDAQS